MTRGGTTKTRGRDGKDEKGGMTKTKGGPGSFPGCTKTQNSTSVVVTGISGDIDVGCLVFIINLTRSLGSKA